MGSDWEALPGGDEEDGESCIRCGKNSLHCSNATCGTTSFGIFALFILVGIVLVLAIIGVVLLATSDPDKAIHKVERLSEEERKEIEKIFLYSLHAMCVQAASTIKTELSINLDEMCNVPGIPTFASSSIDFSSLYSPSNNNDSPSPSSGSMFSF